MSLDKIRQYLNSAWSNGWNPLYLQNWSQNTEKVGLVTAAGAALLIGLLLRRTSFLSPARSEFFHKPASPRAAVMPTMSPRHIECTKRVLYSDHFEAVNPLGRWGEIRGDIERHQEILARLDAAGQQAYLRNLSETLTRDMLSHSGSKSVAVHFDRNYVSAKGKSYVEHGGLLGSDYHEGSYEVFYFRVNNPDGRIEYSLYDIVTQDYEGSRMGHTICFFRLDSPFLKEGVRKGKIEIHERYTSFDRDFLLAQPFAEGQYVPGFGGRDHHVAIPYDSFVTVPVPFSYPWPAWSRRSPEALRLNSQNEEHLAEMLFIHHIATRFPLPRFDPSRLTLVS